jgi:hypothetical protein
MTGVRGPLDDTATIGSRVGGMMAGAPFRLKGTFPERNRLPWGSKRDLEPHFGDVADHDDFDGVTRLVLSQGRIKVFEVRDRTFA